jgi:hypothetical protein
MFFLQFFPQMTEIVFEMTEVTDLSPSMLSDHASLVRPTAEFIRAQ